MVAAFVKQQLKMNVQKEALKLEITLSAVPGTPTAFQDKVQIILNTSGT